MSDARPSDRLDLREMLLEVIDARLLGGSEGHAHADTLLGRWFRRPVFASFSLDALIWGGLADQLDDSVLYEADGFMQTAREELTHGSSIIYRLYLHADLRQGFTPVERDWYEQLADLLQFLHGHPFPDPDAAHEEYTQRMAAIRRSAEQSPPPTYPGDEAVHHRLLREATALLCVHPRTPPWAKEAGGELPYLIPDGAWEAWDWLRTGRGRWQDAAPGIEAARRLLRALSDDDWLVITWQRMPDHYLVSFH